MSKITIIVEKRTSDYKAYVEGQIGLWAPGKGVYEALGNLVNTHAAALNLEIKKL